MAEIVLTAVDAALERKLGVFRGYRYLDDYEAAFGTRSAAEEAQVLIEAMLSDFELVINPFKTHIVELPRPLSDPWTHTIGTFPIRSSTPARQQTDIIGLFSHAADVARHNAGALKYALLKCRDIELRPDIWRSFENAVWTAVSAEPTSMSAALDLLLEKSKEIGKPVTKAAAADVIDGLLARHAPLRNASEVAWALWAAIELRVPIDSVRGAAVESMEDDFVALLTLHAVHRRVLAKSAVDTSEWESLIDYDDVLLGPHWLLAYESALKGWLNAGVSRVARDPFFKLLHGANVSFYKTSPPRRFFTGSAGPLPGAPLPDEYQ